MGGNRFAIGDYFSCFCDNTFINLAVVIAIDNELIRYKVFKGKESLIPSEEFHCRSFMADSCKLIRPTIALKVLYGK